MPVTWHEYLKLSIYIMYFPNDTDKNIKYMTRAKTNLQFRFICIFRLDLVRLQLLLDIIVIKKNFTHFCYLGHKTRWLFCGNCPPRINNLSKNDSSTKPFCTWPCTTGIWLYNYLFESIAFNRSKFLLFYGIHQMAITKAHMNMPGVTENSEKVYYVKHVCPVI